MPVDGTPQVPKCWTLSRATGWINSPPLSAAGLRGHVVLVDVWTYSCINCLRTLPYVVEGGRPYADGLVVVGVHSPEFAFERDPKNVARAVRDPSTSCRLRSNNSFRIWQALDSEYWPTEYLIDTASRIGIASRAKRTRP